MDTLETPLMKKITHTHTHARASSHVAAAYFARQFWAHERIPIATAQPSQAECVLNRELYQFLGPRKNARAGWKMYTVCGVVTCVCASRFYII